MGIFSWVGDDTLPNNVKAVLNNAKGLVVINKPVVESAQAVLAMKLFPGITSAQYQTIVGAFQNAAMAAFKLSGYTYDQKVTAAQSVAEANIATGGLNAALLSTPDARGLLCSLTHTAMTEALAGITANASPDVEASVVAAIQKA